MVSKEEEIVYKPSNTAEAVEYIQKHRFKILEEFAKAFLAESQLLPSEVELVQYEEKEGTIIKTVAYFRKKAKS